tara:strand:+ start:1065 stop:3080 length:2016 start_codon:yes stop_codon:yes gene_type:complete
MATSNTINIKTVLDVNKTLRGISDLKGGIAGVAKNAAKATAGLTVMAAGVGAVTAKAFMMTAQLEKVQLKSQVVFGDQLGMVKAWADSSAAAMGLSSTEAVKLTTNMADLLIPMKFSREEAAKMSTNVVGLSGALSEWSGGTKSAAEVSSILAKAMLGEREQLKTLGISIMENDVKQRVATMGMEDATGAAMQQARAMATQQLIFEKSQDAQTAYAQGSGSLLRVQGELKAQLTTVKDEVLVALIPTMQQLAAFVSAELIPKLREFIPILQEKIPIAIQFIKDAFMTVLPVIKTFISGVGVIIDVIKGMVNYFRESSTAFKVIMVAIAAALLIPFGPASAVIIGVTAFILLIGKIKESWRDMANGVIGMTEGLINGILGLFQMYVENFHMRIVNGTISLINGLIRVAGPLLSKLGIDLQQISHVELPDLQVKIPRLNTAAEEAHNTFTDLEGVMGEDVPEAASRASEAVLSATTAVATGAETIATSAGDAVERMKRINEAFSTSWEDNELALLEAGEAAFDQGHTMNYLAKRINEATEAEKERTDAIAESTAAQITAAQKLQQEGNRMLGRHGVTNAYFDSSGSLQMLPTSAPAWTDFDSRAGWKTSFGDGRAFGEVTNQQLRDLGYITVNVNTGIWEKDEAALGRAIAEAINTAADGSGAVLKPKAVAEQ